MVTLICIDCKQKFIAKRKDTLRCPVCKKKHAVIKTMLSKKKRIPTTEIGVGSGNSFKNTHQPLSIQTYRRAKATQCAWCGSKNNLCVHHLDGDRYNNDLSNLITVCKRCHQNHHTVRNMTTGRYEAKQNP